VNRGYEAVNYEKNMADNFVVPHSENVNHSYLLVFSLYNNLKMVEILVITVLLFVNGVFAMFEIALVSSRKARLEELARAGQKGARVAMKLLKKPEEILSSIQVGITLVGIFSGAFGGIALAEDLVPVFRHIDFLAPYADVLAFTSIVVVITYFSLIIGELVPKTIALSNPEKISILLAPFMQLVGKIAYPLVWILSVSTRIILFFLQIKKDKELPVTEEELRILLKQGSEHGVIEKEESEIINEVIRFGEKRAGSIMTHRSELEWLDTEVDTETLVKNASNLNHSILPVGAGSLDDVLGVVRIKDLLAYYIEHKRIHWESVLLEPLFIPEQLPAIKVLELIRNSRNHFGIVINEYGTIEGIITLHDLMENVMGDFPPGDTGSDPEIFRREDGSYLVEGYVSIEDISDLVRVDLLRETEVQKSGTHTLGGLAMLKLNRIPRVGDRFDIRNIHFEIVDMDGNRVDKLLVSIDPALGED